jgi:hypothetical protein
MSSVVRSPISAWRGIGIFTDPSQKVSCRAPSAAFHETPLPLGFLPDLPDGLGPLHTPSSSAGLNRLFYYVLEDTTGGSCDGRPDLHLRDKMLAFLAVW